MHAMLPIFTLIALLLSGCNSATESADLAPPQPIHDDDICHVCGMLIQPFEGPKGQAFMEGRSNAYKFCSTLDMFVFLQQPENQAQLSHAYVHDIGVTRWESPSDEAFILAKEAWYVIGHNRRGSMGHSLAPFSTREDATHFIEVHGGDIITYEDINLALLAQLGRGEGDDHAHRPEGE
ncbi:nitrous oxide reductase accessory protein NosL [Vreelandella aquamarina]|uniref:nitrous oxide reductase accessory protein NosL n=1 Tax=Vreelandella aquamarina TaxID=77097 RepID=UPI00384A6635